MTLSYGAASGLLSGYVTRKAHPMLDDLSKRELAAIVGALIVVCAQSAWGSIFVIKTYLFGERDDPIARAGGLKAEQIIPAK
jgi:hypothetical protein